MSEFMDIFKQFADGLGFESIIGQTGLLLFLLFTIFKGLRFVKEAERGVKLRFGKVVRHKNGEPKIMEPGFLILIPYIESLVKRHVRQQPIPLDEQVITLKSGLTFRVAGIVFFRVKDVYKALFDIDNLDLSVKELAMGIMKDIVATHNDHADLADTASIAEKIKQQIRNRTDSWGTQTEDFRITVCAPTPESAVIVNLSAAADKKMESIMAAAKKFEMSPEDIVDCGLAAVIAGVPLVSQANSVSMRKRRKLPERESESTFEFSTSSSAG